MSTTNLDAGASLTLAPAAQASLAGRARLAIAWTTGFQIFGDLLQLGLTLVLVRIVAPEAYGQFGFATPLLNLLTLFSCREVLGYILQVRPPQAVPLQDYFTAGAVIQLGIFLITNIVAIAVRWTADLSSISVPLHVMSILFLIDLPSQLRTRMLERALDWRRMRSLQAIGLVAGAATALAIAFAGGGVYALLLPTLVLPLPFVYDLFVRVGWRPDWTWRWPAVRPALAFGASRAAGVGLVATSGLVESGWLASTLGFASFGVFNRAIGLSQLFSGRMGAILGTSMYPVLTQLPPDTDRYRRASAMYLRSVSWTVIPLSLVTSLLAAQVVAILYSTKWAAVVPLAPLAMAVGTVTAIVQSSYTLLLAHGRQNRCFLADLWRLVGTLAILAAVLPFGVRAYLFGLVLVHCIALALIVIWLMQARALTAGGLAGAVLPPLLAAFAAAAAMLFERSWLFGDAGRLWLVVVHGAVFCLTYVAVLRVAFREQLQELVDYLPVRRHLSRWLWLTPVA